jgi:hypothetical protein
MSVPRPRGTIPDSGTPSSVGAAQSRHDFLMSDRLLLSPQDMREYSNRWVAIYRSEVKAVDENYDDLMKRLLGLGLPLGSVAIRFIEKDGMAAP